MQCIILGTGGTMPMPGRFLNSTVARVSGAAYLFDCGEGTQVPYKAHHAGVRRLVLVAVTHLHADHCLGLPGLLMLRAQDDDPPPLALVGPAGLARFVRNVLEDLDCYINYPIRILELSPGLFERGNSAPSLPGDNSEPDEPVEPAAPALGRPSRRAISAHLVPHPPSYRPDKDLLEVYRDERVRLLCAPLKHSTFCVGYRLEELPRPGRFDPAAARRLGLAPGPAYARLQAGASVVNEAGREVLPHEVLGPARRGRHLAFCTDTAPCKGLYRLLDSADLAILEGMYLPEHAAEAAAKQHLETTRAARTAARAGVRATRLTHFSPRYGEDDVARIDALAAEISPSVRAGRDGERIDVPLPD